jgi:hypothetical protein
VRFTSRQRQPNVSFNAIDKSDCSRYLHLTCSCRQVPTELRRLPTADKAAIQKDYDFINFPAKAGCTIAQALGM